MNREQFLAFVEAYTTQDPEVAPLIAGYVQRGLSHVLSDTRSQAADMEIALAAAMDKKLDQSIITDKLKKWKNKTVLNWSNLKEK